MNVDELLINFHLSSYIFLGNTKYKHWKMFKINYTKYFVAATNMQYEIF
jgi:hypothetical protein